MEKLKKGDKIGIVAPAGFIKQDEDLQAALALLKKWELKVVLADSLFKKHHHFAGTDKERTADFQQFLNDDSVKAIWCARGGYGSVRIIDKLDFSKFKKHPKWIIGYSDITVFHQAISRMKLPSIHAIMPTSTISILKSDTAVNSLKSALFGRELNYEFNSNKYNKLGKASGKIVGGNLSLIASLLGTDYSLKTKNKILFIEEIGEYKYSIDRMLQSLKLNGYFNNCKGLIVGSFTKIPKNDPSFGKLIETLILEVVKEFDFPICFGFSAGHIVENQALIFGKKISLEVNSNISKIKF